MRDIAVHGYEVINALPTFRKAALLTGDMMEAAGMSPGPTTDGPGR